MVAKLLISSHAGSEEGLQIGHVREVLSAFPSPTCLKMTSVYYIYYSTIPIMSPILIIILLLCHCG